MKFGRTYNKGKNEVFVRDIEDGSIDVISDHWKEFEFVQSKMFDM